MNRLIQQPMWMTTAWADGISDELKAFDNVLAKLELELELERSYQPNTVNTN